MTNERAVVPYCDLIFPGGIFIGASTRNVFRNLRTRYYLNEFQKGNKVEFVDIPKFLERFRKKDFQEADLSSYSVLMNSGLGWNYYNNYKYSQYYADSRYHFLLTQKDKLAAILGFEPYGESILVTQIQGNRIIEAPFKPIKWANALLNLTCHWASLAGIQEVLVLPSERNFYPVVRENQNGAKMYYDVTARREGFVYDNERKVYVKKFNGENR